MADKVKPRLVDGASAEVLDFRLQRTESKLLSHRFASPKTLSPSAEKTPGGRQRFRNKKPAKVAPFDGASSKGSRPLSTHKKGRHQAALYAVSANAVSCWPSS
jgi:hypothetical protein